VVKTHFSSDGYYRCVTSYTYEAIHAIYTTYYGVFRQKKRFKLYWLRAGKRA